MAADDLATCIKAIFLAGFEEEIRAEIGEPGVGRIKKRLAALDAALAKARGETE